MTEQEKKQVEMHKGFHERCQFAIQSGFYLEAILEEYAAIESRLEALCGVLGAPCGNNCTYRKDIRISSRIECLRTYRNGNTDVFAKTKLPPNFFTQKGELKCWIDDRDKIVHGLYKNEIEYKPKMQGAEKLARRGYEYAVLLYNEVKRIRRMKKKHPELLENTAPRCENKQCKAYTER